MTKEVEFIEILDGFIDRIEDSDFFETELSRYDSMAVRYHLLQHRDEYDEKAIYIANNLVWHIRRAITIVEELGLSDTDLKIEELEEKLKELKQARNGEKK